MGPPLLPSGFRASSSCQALSLPRRGMDARRTVSRRGGRRRRAIGQWPAGAGPHPHHALQRVPDRTAVGTGRFDPRRIGIDGSRLGARNSWNRDEPWVSRSSRGGTAGAAPCRRHGLEGGNRLRRSPRGSLSRRQRGHHADDVRQHWGHSLLQRRATGDQRRRERRCHERRCFHHASHVL
jgi:hypothetical protein